jgi:hypothetical protein
LIVCASSWSCKNNSPYLRDIHQDPADRHRTSIETKYLDALLVDLEACYKKKQP